MHSREVPRRRRRQQSKFSDARMTKESVIVGDRLWFFGTYRYQGNRQYIANIFVNKNAGDATKWNYDPDLTHCRLQKSTFSKEARS
jgi:hypothetical protein